MIIYDQRLRLRMEFVEVSGRGAAAKAFDVEKINHERN
jgi:hypothetical protein